MAAKMSTNKSAIPKKLYCVANGLTLGIFDTYKAVEKSVKKFSKAKHQAFPTLESATEYLNLNGIDNSSIGIHFDADNNVEVSLIDFCEKNGIPVPADIKPVNDSSLPSDTPVVHVDGACKNNGQENPQGGIGIFWGVEHELNQSSCIPSSDKCVPTNNRAELYAAIMAIEQAIQKKLPCLIIRSDSQYVVEGAKSYLHNWKSDESIKTRKNADLWLKLDSLLEKIKVNWQHVTGHSGDFGNEAADKLANKAAGFECVSPTQHEEKTKQCPSSHSSCLGSICIGSVKDGMIACSNCNSWIHYPCTKLPRYQLYKLATTGRKYECEKCTVIPTDFPNLHVNTENSTQTDNFPNLHVNTENSTQTDNFVSLDFGVQTELPSALPVQAESEKRQFTDTDRILDGIENQSKQVNSLRNTFREFESKFFEKLLNSQKHEKDDESLKLKQCENKLENANVQIKNLSKELSAKQTELIALYSKSGKPVTSEIPADCIECCKNLKLLQQQESEYDNLLKINSDVGDERSILLNNCQRLEANVSIKETEILSMRRMIEATQEQLATSRSHADTLQKSINTSLSKIESLNDKVHDARIASYLSSEEVKDFEHPKHFTNKVNSTETPRPTKTDNSNAITVSNMFSVLSEQSPTTVSNDKNADSNYRKSKTTDRDTRDRETYDLLIIGNSHVRRFDPDKLYKNKTSKIVCLEKKTIQGAIQFVEQSKIHAKVVVLHTSDNALTNHNAELCMKDTKTLISACDKKFNNPNVCIVKAMPRFNNSTESKQYNQRACEFNAALDKTNNVTIISADTIKERDYFDDGGVHLTPTGFVCLVRSYKTAVNPILGLKDYNEYSNSPQTSNGVLATPRHLHKNFNPRPLQNYQRQQPMPRRDNVISGLLKGFEDLAHVVRNLGCHGN
jgi:ribonuclease HI